MLTALLIYKTRSRHPRAVSVSDPPAPLRKAMLKGPPGPTTPGEPPHQPGGAPAPTSGHEAWSPVAQESGCHCHLGLSSAFCLWCLKSRRAWVPPQGLDFLGGLTHRPPTQHLDRPSPRPQPDRVLVQLEAARSQVPRPRGGKTNLPNCFGPPCRCRSLQGLACRPVPCSRMHPPPPPTLSLPPSYCLDLEMSVLTSTLRESSIFFQEMSMSSLINRVLLLFCFLLVLSHIRLTEKSHGQF